MKKKICIQGAVAALMAALMTVPALAAPTGDVSEVIEQTWQSAATLIKTVVNSVVFPALDMILVVLLFQRLYGLPQAWADGMGAHCDPFRGTDLFPDCTHLYLDHPWDMSRR